MDDHRPIPFWIEIAKLVLAAPHATDEADALLSRFDAGELTVDALKNSLRALAIWH